MAKVELTMTLKHRLSCLYRVHDIMVLKAYFGIGDDLICQTFYCFLKTGTHLSTTCKLKKIDSRNSIARIRKWKNIKKLADQIIIASNNLKERNHV